MRRAVITVRGRAQKVSYRDLAAEFSKQMDITGIVETFRMGNALKLQQKLEKLLNEFIKLLRAKDEPIIRVKNINVSFQPATGEYSFLFNI